MSIAADDILNGDRRALARAITLIESTRSDHRREAEALLEAILPKTGRSLRIGISGPPGVGKSNVTGFATSHGILSALTKSSSTGSLTNGDRSDSARSKEDIRPIPQRESEYRKQSDADVMPARRRAVKAE